MECNAKMQMNVLTKTAESKSQGKVLQIDNCMLYQDPARVLWLSRPRPERDKLVKGIRHISPVSSV